MPPRVAPSLLIPGAALLSLAVVVGFSFWGYSYDDAFITYRYADNLAAGQGLTYNPDERVLGTTAPGYAAALGTVSRLTRPLGLYVPQWGTLLSLAALVLAGLLPAWWRARPVGERLALSLLFGSLALTSQWNVELLGAETLPVLGLVSAAAVLALASERPAAGGLLVAIAMLFRLDAGLAAASIGVVLWWKRKRFPVAFAVAGLAPLVLGLVWLQGRFGSFLPNSMAGKQAEYGVDAIHYTLSEWSWLRRTLPLVACITLLGLAVAGVFALRRRAPWTHPIALALGLWLLSHELFYRLVRVPFAPWYHVYLLNGLLFLAAYGALAAAESARVHLFSERLSARLRGRVLAVLGAALLLSPVFLSSLRYLESHWRQPPDPRYSIYAEVGEFLARIPGDGRVATVEIGVVGYFSRKPILDLVGLVSPEALQAKMHGRLPELVEEVMPRYIIDAPHFRSAYPVLERPGVAHQYQTIATFEDPRSGRGKIRLLERSPRNP
ncbi:MAG: hypothetical protein GY856_41355 [bacterium]|nr:hypothetical protein [bacterium]